MQENYSDWSVGWYCVRCKPHMESLAKCTLDTLDSVEVFLPRTYRHRNDCKTSPRALFPGYLFAKFDPIKDLRNVHFARGVSYVVKQKNIPIKVPSQAMIELRIIASSGMLEIPDQPHKVGQKIKVISGLFKGEKGKVTQLIPSRERIKVLFGILGRPTEIEINENFVDFPAAHPMRID